MRVASAARCVVIVSLLLCIPVAAQSARPLSLDDAMRRTIDSHPDLLLWRSALDGAQAQVRQAALKPALRLEAELENVLGSGSAAGFGGAELTLSLASVLERGGKRMARQVLAQSRIDGLGIERESKRLDLLAEVARRYLDVASAQALVGIAALDRDQRTRTVAAARRRVDAGAAPRSQLLAAQSALIRSQLEAERAQQGHAAASRRLALLWQDSASELLEVDAAPLALPQLEDFGALQQRLRQTPELQQFASEQRQRAARIELARSGRIPDLEWQVGVRRLQEQGDFGVVAGLSIALGSAARSQPEIDLAQAELDALEPQQRSRELALDATLAEAHGRYGALALEARQLGEALIPSLLEAEKAAAQAYTAGALSYLEWAQLQSETTAARRQQLVAALDAQRALIEIQRLTGQPIVALSQTAKDSTP